VRQLTLDLRPERAPHFDNFAAGENREALDTVRMLSRFGQPAAVYLWGETGCGKTHLLTAAAAETRAGGHAVAEAKVVADDGDFDLPENGLLCVDDVQHLDAAGQAALFRAYIRAPARRCALLMAGDAPPSALRLREDVRTRIGQCLIFELQPLADGHKAEMLALYALSRGLMLEPELITWILQHGRRDLPSLLAAIDTLDTISLARRRSPSLPLLREIAQESLFPTETA
jgi:DnaA family protein